jgi:hypothetical protein
MVFKNSVVRKLFGPNREEVTGDWRKLHSDELHLLYVLSNIVRVMRWRLKWVEFVAHMGER